MTRTQRNRTAKIKRWEEIGGWGRNDEEEGMRRKGLMENEVKEGGGEEEEEKSSSVQRL